jgi:hypothetical protein
MRRLMKCSCDWDKVISAEEGETVAEEREWRGDDVREKNLDSARNELYNVPHGHAGHRGMSDTLPRPHQDHNLFWPIIAQLGSIGYKAALRTTL